MYMYYSSKRYLVQVERPEQEGEIHTIYGTLPVKPNDVLATDEFGVQFVMSEKHFQENYVPVEKIKKDIDIDAMASAYAQTGELVKQSNENNEDYIFDIKK
jgi:hypothetical protein